MLPYWSSDWTRATLPSAVLTLLLVKPDHGYDLIGRLGDMGFRGVRGGTLYPLLARLEEQGYLTHSWEHEQSGPGRKVFSVTPPGEVRLTELREEASRVVTLLDEIRRGEKEEHQ